MEARSQLRHRPTCLRDATSLLSPLGRDSSNSGSRGGWGPKEPGPESGIRPGAGGRNRLRRRQCGRAAGGGKGCAVGRIPLIPGKIERDREHFGGVPVSKRIGARKFPGQARFRIPRTRSQFRSFRRRLEDLRGEWPQQADGLAPRFRATGSFLRVPEVLVLR